MKGEGTDASEVECERGVGQTDDVVVGDGGGVKVQAELAEEFENGSEVCVVMKIRLAVAETLG